MPMNDHDELLTRVDDWLENTPLVVHAGTVQMVERLAAALRAALAARPQPLLRGAIIDNRSGSGGSPVVLIELDGVDPLRELDDLTDEEIMVYPAAAGSATLTQEDDND